MVGQNNLETNGNLEMVVYCEAKLLLCEPHIVIYTIIMKVYGISMYTTAVYDLCVCLSCASVSLPTKKHLPKSCSPWSC